MTGWDRGRWGSEQWDSERGGKVKGWDSEGVRVVKGCLMKGWVVIEWDSELVGNNLVGE